MKLYQLDTKFTFGKHEGKTVKEVLEIEDSYLTWCALYLDHFYISNEVIEEIKAIKPDFRISEEASASLTEKFENWMFEQEYHHEDFDEPEATYENYNGSYAQDVEGWSDQDIDDVFDGDPDAYWNID
jgi:hypothetical protein